MLDAYIYDGIRSPIGRHAGKLAPLRPDDLAGEMIAEVVKRNALKPEDISDVILGCVTQAGEDCRNVARFATLMSGLPPTVPGVTVNRLCASGLQAVTDAARAITSGEGELYIAGGVESMSRAPYSVPRGPHLPATGNPTMWDTSLGWRYPNPKMAAMFPLEAMGETAENLAERGAISRADQDSFALESHRRAIAAQDRGWFDAEIVGVLPPGKQATLVSADEGPRRDTSMEKLARLEPAFRKGGTVTAGNSSTLNDGAAALLLMDADAARAQGLAPRVRIVACSSAGVDPRFMGIGPVPAVRKALAASGWGIGDVDLWELNEAFAAQSLAVVRELGLPLDRVNRLGGAIALGHPLGCSGARLVVTLMHAMERLGATRGCATLCVGVGQGVAVLLERVN